jgi:prophage regulatory protein
MSNTILRLPTVKARTGASRSSIYLWVSEGSFPRPVSLGARAVGWIESEVDEWISGRIRQSRSGDSVALKHGAR